MKRHQLLSFRSLRQGFKFLCDNILNVLKQTIFIAQSHFRSSEAVLPWHYAEGYFHEKGLIKDWVRPWVGVFSLSLILRIYWLYSKINLREIFEPLIYSPDVTTARAVQIRNQALLVSLPRGCRNPRPWDMNRHPLGMPVLWGMVSWLRHASPISSVCRALESLFSLRPVFPFWGREVCVWLRTGKISHIEFTNLKVNAFLLLEYLLKMYGVRGPVCFKMYRR